MELNKHKMKHQWLYKLLALTGIIAATCVAGIVAWRAQEHSGSKEISRLLSDTTSSQGRDTLRRGDLNGTPFAIPSNYLVYPIEYLDTSTWDPKKPKIRYKDRSYADAIQEFTVRIHWPTHTPRIVGNSRSFPYSKYHSGTTEWVSVSVNHGYVNASRPPLTRDNGMARVLRGGLERLSDIRQIERPLKVRDANTGADVIVRGVHYEMRRIDPETELQSAIPVGHETDTFHLWNISMYWSGDMNGVVDTLIICHPGKMKIVNDPDAVGKCQHHFELEKLKAQVTLYYPISLLTEWSDLQDMSTRFILSLRQPS